MRGFVNLTIFWLGFVGVVELPGPPWFPSWLSDDLSLKDFSREVFSTVPRFGVAGFGWGRGFILAKFGASRWSDGVFARRSLRGDRLLATAVSGVGGRCVFAAPVPRPRSRGIFASIVRCARCYGVFAAALWWLCCAGSRQLRCVCRALSAGRSDWSCADSSPRWHGNQIQVRRRFVVRRSGLIRRRLRWLTGLPHRWGMIRIPPSAAIRVFDIRTARGFASKRPRRFPIASRRYS